MNFSKDAMGHGYAFVNLQNIFGNNVVDVKSLGLAEASEKQLLEYSLQKGDVLFVRSSVKLEGVGEAALVAETLENTTYSGFIIRFRDEYGLNNDFKKFVCATKKVRDQIMSQATNSANKNISQSVLENLTFEIPSKDEQKQIGEYFSSLDNLITLHQRKYSKLLNVKESMLEKMFPKNGSNIPEIRFKGFTDPWEQRKAKELFVSTADKGYPELPVLSATQNRGMIRRDENSINIFHDKKNEAGYKRVLPGQFVIHLRSFQGGFAHSAIEGITSPAYTVFGFSEPEKHDSEYWKYVFTSKSFIRRLETVTYGIRDGRSISYDEFLTLGFAYPSKAEQTAIAQYLDKLSDLITLHQRELEKLQNIKKSMLEKMFV